MGPPLFCCATLVVYTRLSLKFFATPWVQKLSPKITNFSLTLHGISGPCCIRTTHVGNNDTSNSKSQLSSLSQPFAHWVTNINLPDSSLYHSLRHNHYATTNKRPPPRRCHRNNTISGVSGSVLVFVIGDEERCNFFVCDVSGFCFFSGLLLNRLCRFLWWWVTSSNAFDWGWFSDLVFELLWEDFEFWVICEGTYPVFFGDGVIVLEWG